MFEWPPLLIPEQPVECPECGGSVSIDYKISEFYCCDCGRIVGIF